MANNTEHRVAARRNPLTAARGYSPSRAAASRAERWLLERMYRAIGAPPLCLRLWDGTTAGVPQSDMRIELRDRGALYRLLWHPNLAFGDLYSSGRLEIHGELTRVLDSLIDHAGQPSGKGAARRRWLSRGRSLAGADPAAARGNIHYHYDLGNAFYRLWLDGVAMQYTCAYFENPAFTLEQAQLAKLEHVCRKLRLEPGQTVIEAGCGWGGLARYMARHYGVRVRAFNISREQISHAREQARQQGIDDQVEFIEDDYRNISGTCDRFVSVGMLEHVGKSNYEALAGVIGRCLQDEGIGLVHTIGRNRPAPLDPWIQKRIFPGAYVPGITELMGMFESIPFSVLDVENLRLHYAQTLQHWLGRFREHREQVVAWYGEPFARAWELYLAGSEATFRHGGLQLFQVVFAWPGCNRVQRNRRHLYSDPVVPREDVTI